MTIISGGSSSSSQTNLVHSVAALAVSSLVTAAVCCKILDAKHQKSTAKWEKKRQEERVGRIRAEQKLREALTKLKKARLDVDDGDDAEDDDHVLPLKTLGIVQSPYPKRMGTPRQGALVPSSRGCIQFVQSVPPELLDGIDQYSHLWVIFQFHENTSLATSKKTKIRPPRGGGIKVGMMATRSPHRPNPLGLSLVTIDRWEPSNRKLYIKALDLVDGTPGTFHFLFAKHCAKTTAFVSHTYLFCAFCLCSDCVSISVYDVKPYVHWDIPNEVKVQENRIGGGIGLKLPPWVENKDDILPSVAFEPEAEETLRYMIRHNKLSPSLYPSKDSMSFVAAKQTLIEILSQDPRSSHRGLSKNQRGSISSPNSQQSQFSSTSSVRSVASSYDVYKLSFGNAVIEFVVTAKGAIVKNVVDGSLLSPTSVGDISIDDSTTVA